MFALPSGVLLIRCAWHRRYRGHPRLIGVGSWHGWGVQFTDGICNRCATRVIDEPTRVPSRSARGRRGARPALLFLGLPLTAAVVLAAAPLSEPPPRSIPSALPAALTAASESRGPGTGLQAAMVAPPLVPVISAAGRGRGVTMRRSPLTARAMVIVAKGVERVDIQTP
jgi:hypothetical protein